MPTSPAPPTVLQIAPASGQCPRCQKDVLLVQVDKVGPALIEIERVVSIKIHQKLHARTLAGSVVQAHLPHTCEEVQP